MLGEPQAPRSDRVLVWTCGDRSVWTYPRHVWTCPLSLKESVPVLGGTWRRTRCCSGLGMCPLPKPERNYFSYCFYHLHLDLFHNYTSPFTISQNLRLPFLSTVCFSTYLHTLLLLQHLPLSLIFKYCNVIMLVQYVFHFKGTSTATFSQTKGN